MFVARLQLPQSKLDRHFGRVCLSLIRNERIERSSIQFAKMLHQSLALIILHSRQAFDAAELLIKTNGDASKAAEYLNRVHHRAGLTDNLTANEENILQERALEFVGEGKRYWDLVRTGKAASVLVPDSYGYRTNKWTESKKYLPIPQNEIDAAQGTLTQNNY